MVDYWEVLGRMVTDDTLRKSVFDSFTVGPYVFDTVRYRATIPEIDFKTASKLLSAVIPDRPVSLLSVGELLFNISFKGFRDNLDTLAGDIKTAGVSTAGVAALFFAALGAMTVDDTVRDLFQGNDFKTAQFDALVQSERNELRKLTDPATSDFKKHANKLCGSFWIPECKLKLNFYQGHQHLADNLPPPPGVVPNAIPQG